MRFRIRQRPSLPMDPMRLLILCLLISALEIFAGAGTGNAVAVIFGFLPFAILGFSWWRSQKKALSERESGVSGSAGSGQPEKEDFASSRSSNTAANPAETERKYPITNRTPWKGRRSQDNGHPPAPPRFLMPSDLIKPPSRFEAVKPPKTWRDEIDEF